MKQYYIYRWSGNNSNVNKITYNRVGFRCGSETIWSMAVHHYYYMGKNTKIGANLLIDVWVSLHYSKAETNGIFTFFTILEIITPSPISKYRLYFK